LPAFGHGQDEQREAANIPTDKEWSKTDWISFLSPLRKYLYPISPLKTSIYETEWIS
jgi:hypothetical protein